MTLLLVVDVTLLLHLVLVLHRVALLQGGVSSIVWGVQCTVYCVQYSGRGWAWLVPHPAIHRELPRPRSHQQQTSASLSLTSAW